MAVAGSRDIDIHGTGFAPDAHLIGPESPNLKAHLIPGNPAFLLGCIGVVGRKIDVVDRLTVIEQGLSARVLRAADPGRDRSAGGDIGIRLPDGAPKTAGHDQRSFGIVDISLPHRRNATGMDVQ